MKTKDPVCEFCKIKKLCHTVKDECAPLSWIDGKKSSKEKLFLDVKRSSTETESRDYNEVLAEMITDHEVDIEKICEISDCRIRMIAAALYVNIPKEEIARQLGISSRQLRRQTNGK